MTTKLDEFAINLPMVGVTGVGEPGDSMGAEVPAYSSSCPMYDVTADVDLPADVAPSCDHINVSVDSASQTTWNTKDQMTNVDIVLTVSITDPETGNVNSYKVVKRISMDKLKLAVQVENETPYQIVEAKTPEQEAEILAEAQAQQRALKAAARARQLAGIGE
jgi:hypothetical protein